MKLTRMYHNKKTKKELTMLKKHLLILALVSSSVIGVYAMEEEEKKPYKKAQHVRGPDGKMYRKSDDGDQIRLTPLAQGNKPIQARISDGEESQAYTDIRTAEVISMTIISREGKEKNHFKKRAQ